MQKRRDYTDQGFFENNQTPREINGGWIDRLVRRVGVFKGKDEEGDETT